MKRVLITKVVPVGVSESHFIIHDDGKGYFDWIIEKYAPKLPAFKQYGKNIRVECTHCIDGNEQPCHVFINNARWGNRLPTAEELRDEAQLLKSIFQDIMDAWKKAEDKSTADEIEWGKNHKLFPLPQIPVDNTIGLNRFRAAIEVKELVDRMEKRFLESQKNGKYEDCRIDLLDQSYALHVLKALVAKKFNPKRFPRLVRDADTAARDKMPDSVWKIVEGIEQGRYKMVGNSIEIREG